jgi:hypothetical protein
MSDWITDRPPKKADADRGLVWTMYNGKSVLWNYDQVAEGTPWMPITPPEPYVKPQRYAVVEWYDSATWTVEDRVELCLVCRPLPTREAAESMAAIYEELMP